MRGVLFGAVLFLVAGCAAASGGPAGPPGGPPAIDYQVRLRDLEVVSVRACPSGFDPGGFEPARPSWARWVQDLRPAGTCVEYRVRVGDAARIARGRSFARTEGAVMVPPALWLLRPNRTPPGLSLRLRILREEGAAYLSVPFPKRGPLWRPEPTVWSWLGRSVLSRRPPLVVEAGETQLEVVTLGPPLASGVAALSTWLRDAVAATRAVFGRFPLSRVQVVLQSRPGSAPLFGMTHRGGGAGLYLLVGRDCDGDAFRRDWIAVHEMLHLGHPRMSGEDAWLYEGLATLYEPIGRVRAGQLEERQGWQRIVEGLNRGRADGTGRSLAEESAHMNRTGAYRRVYWGGAAVLLAAELRARRRGGSLDPFLRRLATCCRSATRPEAARSLIRRLASGVAREALDESMATYLDAPEFPDLSADLEVLGVEVGEDGRISLNDAAPEASIRRGLMHRP